MGKILRVDLTTGNITEELLKEEYVEKFIGGRGLAAKMLFDEVPAKIDPLSPQNKLIFVTGPLTGTPTPCASHFVLATKSPLTNIYAYAVAGGGFGPALKRSGYDDIIIEGESPKPAYLFINEGKATLKDAEWLWGTPVFEASRLVKEAVGHNVSIALIGPAGEKLVKIAAVMTDDRRAAARAGPGAVMGSKKLKAVVVTGQKELAIAHREALLQSIKQFHEAMLARKKFSETGTQATPRLNDAWGILPTKNWQEAVFDGVMKISHPSLREKFVIKDVGCPGCPVKCTKITLVRDGPYAGALTEGPEYETLYAFGSACGVDSPEAIITADMLCDNFGLDTISTGVTIAWAMECFEKGILSLEDTDGLGLRFGDHEAVMKAIKKIAYREGKIGQLLAEGSREASKRIAKGAERYAMQVKGLELGGYDPRGSRGMALIFACGPRGGCHHAYGLPSQVELPKGTGLQSAGKGLLVRSTARSRIIFDSLPLCSFIARTAPLELVAKLISSVTGIDMTVERLEKTADRTAIVERTFNARERLSEKDDILPERLITEPLPSGPNKGQVVTLSELEHMKKEFYEAMGWEPNTGLPTRAKMEALELEDIAEQLAALGILPK